MDFSRLQANKIIEFLLSFEGLPPEYRQLLNLQLQNLETSESDALIPNGIGILTESRSISGKVTRRVVVNYMLIMRRVMGDPNYQTPAAYQLAQDIISWVNARQLDRYTPSGNPLTPVFGNGFEDESIRASGGEIQSVYEQGLTDLAVQIQCQYTERYDAQGVRI